MPSATWIPPARTAMAKAPIGLLAPEHHGHRQAERQRNAEELALRHRGPDPASSSAAASTPSTSLG